MDYRTAAAISQNLAGIGDAFLQTLDPANNAKAALMRGQNALLGAQLEGQNIENRYAPNFQQSRIDMNRASAGQSNSAAGLNRSKMLGQDIQNQAGQLLLDGFTEVPTTSFTQGGRYGPDEMTDPNTERGYTSTGRNLSPGVVATNPSVYPRGTVFQSTDGKAYIAADTHGNANPNVVDIYRLPQEYKAQSGPQLLKVVGRENIPYGTTAEQLAALRAKYERQAGLSNIFSGGGAADLATGTAKMAALNAPDEMAARRALAAQGVAMNQGEYFEPTRSDAFQNRKIQGELNQEALRQQGAMQRTATENVFKALVGGRGGVGSSSSSTGGGNFNPFEGAKETGNSTLARFSIDGEKIAEADLPKAQAWATSVSMLTSMNVPFEIAKSFADKHHGLPTQEDGLLSSPHMSYNQFDPNPISPEQAAQIAAKYGVGSGAAPDVQRIMSFAQVFGGGFPQVAAANNQGAEANQPANVQTSPAATAPAAVPQTGTDRPPGKALGTELEKADKQKGMDRGTAYNAGTLGNIMRAAKAEGVPFEDILATAAAGGEANDQQIARIFSTSKGLGVLAGGGANAADLRNALNDVRALKAANLNPERVSAYFRSNGQPAQSGVQIGKYIVQQ